MTVGSINPTWLQASKQNATLDPEGNTWENYCWDKFVERRLK